MLRNVVLSLVILLAAVSAEAQGLTATPPVCAKNGEDVDGSAIGSPHECCAGLSFTSAYGHARFLAHGNCAKAQEEAKLPPPGMGGTCTKCGDGVCTEPEDNCNCPADCKK